jgi:predicted HAD superfamily Cof-like phosphohydrolase
MTNEQKLVEEFHRAFELTINTKPILPELDVLLLRVKLISEECIELIDALGERDLVKVADGIADVLYVVYGTAVTCGIDVEPLFSEIHRSNMSKIGGIKRDDGKVLKPDTYSPPDVAKILQMQMVDKHEK